VLVAGRAALFVIVLPILSASIACPSGFWTVGQCVAITDRVTCMGIICDARRIDLLLFDFRLIAFVIRPPLFFRVFALTRVDHFLSMSKG
jgi:hypothetical protein